MADPLGRCPRCGAKLLTRNPWPSCGYATLQCWYGHMRSRAPRMCDRFERRIARCGEYHVSPAKTRVAFLARVRFAGITRVSEERMSCRFAPPYPLRSRRFVRVEEVVPGWWIHRMEVREPRPLDERVQGRLRRSHRLMGIKGRLKGRARLRVPGA